MPAKQKAYKRMTVKEKKVRQEVKKELQSKGILPPDKKKLNRKKFAKDVWQEFNEVLNEYGDYLFLREAIGCMVSDNMLNVTTEEVGVLKLMKLSIELKKFHKAQAEQGKTTYTLGELCEKVVKPVLKL